MTVERMHGSIWDRYTQAIETGATDVLRDLRADDVTKEFPQSGERFVGRESILASESLDRSRPSFQGPRWITSLGPDAFVAEALLGGERAGSWLVARLDLHADGRIHREIEYVADPFEAPEWRSRFVVPFDPTYVTDGPSVNAIDDGTSEELIRRLLEASTTGDLETGMAGAHPDWEGYYPQSGERFVGAQAIIDAHRDYPGGLPEEHVIGLAGAPDTWTLGPLMIPTRVTGGGASWLGETAITYANGIHWFQVAIAILREGRLWRLRMYYVPTTEAPDRRAHLVERFDPTSPRRS